jgi:hypothetical protein
MPFKLRLALSRIFARLHLWTPAVVALAGVRPLSLLSQVTRLRFSYTCILARENPLARNAFSRMLRSNIDRSAADDLCLAYTAWCFGALNLSQTINRRIERRYPGTAEAAIANREAAFASSIARGELRAAIAAAATAIPSTNPEPLIIVPASAAYLELFDLWKRQLDRHVSGTLVALAMDQFTVESFRRQNHLVIDLSSYFGYYPNGRIEDYSMRHLWILRVFILRELIVQGHTVLSLDLDAVLVGDLQPLLDQFPDADVIVQKDYSIPIDIARKLGSIACCGFLHIRSNPATMRFLDSYVDATVLELDDQTAINHLIAAAGIENRTETPAHLAFNSLGLSWICPAPSLVSRDISYGTVIRHFQQSAPLDTAQLEQRLGLK